jgi:hypothetical protein
VTHEASQLLSLPYTEEKLLHFVKRRKSKQHFVVVHLLACVYLFVLLLDQLIQLFLQDLCCNGPKPYQTMDETIIGRSEEEGGGGVEYDTK